MSFTWKIASFSGRTTGIEPASDGVTVHCLTTWLRPPDTYTWGYQIWVPLSSHFFISLFFKRVTWFEHATSNLEGWHSTIELYPLMYIITKDMDLSRASKNFFLHYTPKMHLSRRNINKPNSVYVVIYLEIPYLEFSSKFIISRNVIKIIYLLLSIRVYQNLFLQINHYYTSTPL